MDEAGEGNGKRPERLRHQTGENELGDAGIASLGRNRRLVITQDMNISDGNVWGRSQSSDFSLCETLDVDGGSCRRLMKKLASSYQILKLA